MDSKTEVWKKHPDIPGIEVSTFGRVRMQGRLGSRENRTYSKKGHVLKQSNSSNGYLQVRVLIDGKPAVKYVHRLVAQIFLPNPEKLPQVNHRDCDRKNNNITNLEFCTASYNAKYREKFGVSQTESKGQPLFAINLSTLEVLHFRSQGEAGRALGLFNQNINKVIKGRYKSTGGYWFVNDDGHAVDVVKSKLHDVGGVGLKIKQGR